MLSELKSLHAEFGGFGSKLDSIDDRLGKMASSIATLETNLSEVKQNVSSNTKRTEEAENRIAAAEELTEKNQTELTKAMKKIASLESKAEDLENRSRRKNLRLFGLREGAEGSRPLLEFMQEMLPRWLGSDTGRSFILERVHRTLAPPKPNQDRAVLIRFLQFQDREFVFDPLNSVLSHTTGAACSSPRTSRLRPYGSGARLMRPGKCLPSEGPSADSSIIHAR